MGPRRVPCVNVTSGRRVARNVKANGQWHLSSGARTPAVILPVLPDVHERRRASIRIRPSVSRAIVVGRGGEGPRGRGAGGARGPN
jgi:hypothetical protein